VSFVDVFDAWQATTDLGSQLKVCVKLSAGATGTVRLKR
jgi:hypothetical protein